MRTPSARYKEEKTPKVMPPSFNDDRVREDIYHSRQGLETAMVRLQGLPNGRRANEFLQHLHASGLSTARVGQYAVHLPRVLRSLDISTAGRKEIEAFVAELNRSDYKAWTKHGYKLVVKKLFQYLRYGSTLSETPYPPEVSWISVRVTQAEIEKESRANAENLLSPEDAARLFKAAETPRDEAMLYVLFEGAFRPGELLAMRVGSVQFLKDYCVVSTKGKTGQKRIPLVVSFRPLMRWLSIHPLRSDPKAPLWCAMDTGHRGNQISYPNFRIAIAKVAERAGLKKDVWPRLTVGSPHLPAPKFSSASKAFGPSRNQSLTSCLKGLNASPASGATSIESLSSSPRFL